MSTRICVCVIMLVAGGSGGRCHKLLIQDNRSLHYWAICECLCVNRIDRFMMGHSRLTVELEGWIIDGTHAPFGLYLAEIDHGRDGERRDDESRREPCQCNLQKIIIFFIDMALSPINQSING